MTKSNEQAEAGAPRYWCGPAIKEGDVVRERFTGNEYTVAEVKPGEPTLLRVDGSRALWPTDSFDFVRRAKETEQSETFGLDLLSPSEDRENKPRWEEYLSLTGNLSSTTSALEVLLDGNGVEVDERGLGPKDCRLLAAMLNRAADLLESKGGE